MSLSRGWFQRFRPSWGPWYGVKAPRQHPTCYSEGNQSCISPACPSFSRRNMALGAGRSFAKSQLGIVACRCWRLSVDWHSVGRTWWCPRGFYGSGREVSFWLGIACSMGVDCKIKLKVKSRCFWLSWDAVRSRIAQQSTAELKWAWVLSIPLDKQEKHRTVQGNKIGGIVKGRRSAKKDKKYHI